MSTDQPNLRARKEVLPGAVTPAGGGARVIATPFGGVQSEE